MRVYISCHNPDLANDLAAVLKAAGHEVVSTWHSDPGPRPARDDAGAWAAKTVDNLAQIGAADALALIAGPERYPGGKFVEAGYALCACVKVFTVGGVENGMLHHPGVKHTKDAAELLALLN